ncbi:putative ribonuclease H protein [Trifolium medium]|uniref:Putative ribonuclease H protein n=1 Tax=Trifolium medium TaxID=97028 RepID=A0A392LXK8_9FABA|nr:putative ribonuclease H protein [Trifolium medium]
MKLSSWKANQLSFTGRVTLAKSVIEAIPIYPMMTNIIPKACLAEIPKMQRRFIWDDNENTRRYHAVGWDMLTRPKSIGGLGLRRLEVMWGKYKRAADNDGVVARISNSHLWKAIAKLWPKLDELSVWSIGNGSSVDICHDLWKMELEYIESNDWLPPHFINKIAALPPPSVEAGEDTCHCMEDTVGKFKIAEMYKALCGFNDEAYELD